MEHTGADHLLTALLVQLKGQGTEPVLTDEDLTEARKVKYHALPTGEGNEIKLTLERDEKVQDASDGKH